MSLLNEVLQDLDERGDRLDATPIRVAQETGNRADPGVGLARSWTRGLLGVALTLAAVLVATRGITPQAPAEPGASRSTDLTTLADASVRPTAAAPAEAVESSQQPQTVSRRYRFHVYDVEAPPAFAHLDTPPGQSRAPRQNDYLPLRNTDAPPTVAQPESPKVRRPQRTASRIAPAEVKASSPLADIRGLIAAGESAQALRRLRERLAERPGDQVARELLIGLLLRDQQVEMAIAELASARSRHPENRKFLLISARLLAQEGQSLAAIHLLGSSGPHRNTAEVLQMLGALNQQQGRFAAAVTSYQALLDLNPDSGAARVGLAIGLDSLGDRSALQHYREALVLGGLPRAAAAYASRRTRELESAGG